MKGTNSTLPHLPGIFWSAGEQSHTYIHTYEAVTHHEAAFLPPEPTRHSRAQWMQTVGTLLLQLSGETGMKGDRTNPT